MSWVISTKAYKKYHVLRYYTIVFHHTVFSYTYNQLLIINWDMEIYVCPLRMFNKFHAGQH